MPKSMSTTPKTSFVSRLMRPRIWQNGLILVLLPLMINAVWIAMLGDALQKSQTIVDQERYRAQVQAKLNSLVFIYAKAFSDMVTAFLQGSPGYEREAQASFILVRKEFIDLNTMTAKDPEIHHWVARAQADWEAAFSELTKIAQGEVANGDTPVPFLGQFKRTHRWSKDFQHVSVELFSKMAAQQSRLDDLARQELQSRETVQRTVIFGLVANFLVAILLFVVFVRNITGRVYALMENAHRLPQNMPLERQVGGRDELAELDQVLQNASIQLSEAAEFRQSLMQMMAHDLRSPLASCMVSIDLIERSEKDTITQSGQRHIRSISRSIERLINLINDLLTLEGLEAGKIEIDPNPENLKEVIDTAVETVRSLAEIKDVELINHAAREYVEADRARLLQVLVNLLSNAIKFSPPHAAIDIYLERLVGEVKITVQDKGEGLSREDRKNLFQKFFQSAAGKKAGGSGLGLAICKLIVESHGGNIGVTTAPGGGASFWFTIPAGRDEDN